MTSAKPANATAFSLIEVTLAIGVAAISLLTIFGLLVTGTRVGYTATEQSAAADIMTSVANDLRSTPSTNSVSSVFNISIPSGGSTAVSTLYFTSQGTSSTTLNNDSRYRINISFRANGGGSRTATFLSLKATWPAPADPLLSSTQSAELFVALDRT